MSDVAAQNSQPENQQVRYFVLGKEVFLDDAASMPSRTVRKLFAKEGKKIAAKFGHLVHPETGERPDIWLVVTAFNKFHIPQMEARLTTDSSTLREWLKSKGIVISEVVAQEGADAPAGV